MRGQELTKELIIRGLEKDVRIRVRTGGEDVIFYDWSFLKIGDSELEVVLNLGEDAHG